MTPTKDTPAEPVEEAAPGAGPDWGELPHGKLTNAIIGAMFEVHKVLGAGFLERNYANALAIELRFRGIAVERNVPFDVLYRGVVVGRYFADLVVDQRVIVETKVAKAIDAVHRAQLLNYLRASGLEVGLVLNFSTSAQFKRVVATSGSHRIAANTNTNSNSNSNSKT
jgi:GxxExxY protein